MRAELAALSRILAVVNRAALWIAGIGLVLMTVFVAWQVFGRYVLNQSPSWTEPASLLLMSWFILLGSAVGVREGNHLGFEIALHYAPHGLRQIMLGVTEVLVMIFGGAMSWYGTMLAVETWSAAMPGLPIPQGIDYVPLAVGGRSDRAFLPREIRSPAARRRGCPDGARGRAPSRCREGLMPWRSGFSSASSRSCCSSARRSRSASASRRWRPCSTWACRRSWCSSSSIPA